MLGEGGTALSKLRAAVAEFQAREERRADPKVLRSLIDALEREFAAEVRSVQHSGDHLANGMVTAVSWISRTCGMSATSAADRICVGDQLESLPKVAEALSSGDIGYQSASLLCHLRDQLGDKRDLFDEDEMLGLACRNSVAGLRFLCRYARHVADPDGFFTEAEEDYSRRKLSVSLMSDGMHAIDGVLDAEGGAVLRTALDSLAKRMAPDDERTYRQRMADALVECVHHAMDEGKLPRRNGVSPQVTVTTTLEGLKNELGAPAADLELSLPISTRTVSPPTRRALRTRDRGCRWPGCDRQVSWSTPHHIIAWSRGGGTNLPNLVLLCFHHQRLVHEGGRQVVKAGRGLRFVPPARVVMKRARGPGLRWAA